MNLMNLYNQIRMHEYIHTEQKPAQDSTHTWVRLSQASRGQCKTTSYYITPHSKNVLGSQVIEVARKWTPLDPDIAQPTAYSKERSYITVEVRWHSVLYCQCL